MNNTSSPVAVPADQRHRAATLSRWQAIVDDFLASGLTTREFCQSRGICEPSFYTWRKRLSQRSLPSTLPAFVPVVVQGGVNRSAKDDPYASIELRGGRVLRLPMSMPAARLAELVHALEGLQ